MMLLEIGFDQKEEILNLANQSGKYKKIETKQDLFGNDRVIALYQ